MDSKDEDKLAQEQVDYGDVQADMAADTIVNGTSTRSNTATTTSTSEKSDEKTPHAPTDSNNAAGNGRVEEQLGDNDEKKAAQAGNGTKAADDGGQKEAAVPEPRVRASRAQDGQRSKRMFGFLMGTLDKFKAQSENNEERDRKRRAIDTKLLARLEKEKQAGQQEKERARLERRLKEAKLLSTSTKPHLRFLPHKLTESQQEHIDRQVKQCQDELDALAHPDTPSTPAAPVATTSDASADNAAPPTASLSST